MQRGAYWQDYNHLMNFLHHAIDIAKHFAFLEGLFITLDQILNVTGWFVNRSKNKPIIFDHFRVRFVPTFTAVLDVMSFPSSPPPSSRSFFLNSAPAQWSSSSWYQLSTLRISSSTSSHFSPLTLRGPYFSIQSSSSSLSLWSPFVLLHFMSLPLRWSLSSSNTPSEWARF